MEHRKAEVYYSSTEKKKWQNQGKLQHICAKEVQNVFKFFVNEGTKFDFSGIIHEHWYLTFYREIFIFEGRIFIQHSLIEKK